MTNHFIPTLSDAPHRALINTFTLSPSSANHTPRAPAQRFSIALSLARSAPAIADTPFLLPALFAPGDLVGKPQLSQVYSTLKLDRLSELIPFVEPARLEKCIVQAVKDNVISVRVCHRTRSIQFGGNAFLTQTDRPEDGPKLQSLQSEMMRGQLTTLAKRLHEATAMMTPTRRDQERKSRRRALLVNMDAKLKEEHQANLNRKQIIEKRKVYIEMANEVSEQERLDALEAARLKAKEKEEQRQAEEEKRRKEMRIQQERKNMEHAVAMEKVTTLSQTAIGARVIKSLTKEELASISADQIVQMQVDMLEKERRELNARLKATERKVDYLERAKRLVEIPKLKDQFAARGEDSKRFWQEQVTAAVESSKREHGRALQLKSNLQRMVPAKDAFVEALMAKRRAQFEEERAEFDRKMEEQVRSLEPAPAVVAFSCLPVNEDWGRCYTPSPFHPSMHSFLLHPPFVSVTARIATGFCLNAGAENAGAFVVA